jgi:serine/threonine protein kinase
MLHLEKGQIMHSRFSLTDLLGEGGMGQVWLVRDLELQIDVAIKVLNPRLTASPDSLELLKNECRNTRRLIHPHIVRIFDFHRSDDLAFISMEYIEGEDLSIYKRRSGMIPCTAVVPRILPIIEALSYAHSLGIVHRDVKANNVLIDYKEGPHLVDFGIAGVLRNDVDALDITTGGSMYSMSPQQLDGHAPRPSDDIYGLGTMIYELLIGHPPFFPDITPERIREEGPLTVNQQLNQLEAKFSIPESLNILVAQMLAKVPDERPGSMAHVRDELRKTLDITLTRTIPPGLPSKAPTKALPVDDEVEIIKPERTVGTGEGGHRSNLTLRHLLKAVTLLFALIALVVGGGLLLQYLSKNPMRIARVPGETETPIHETMPQPPDDQEGQSAVEQFRDVDAAEADLSKEQAEKNLADFLSSRKFLDTHGAEQWGGNVYNTMIQLSQEADALFMKEDYGAASLKYSEAIVVANKLAHGMREALGRLLDDGRSALEVGHGELAQQKFKVALMIDPTNANAQRGLKRASTIERVFELVESGRRHELDNNPSLAHVDYREALRLDPESNDARTALNRVKGLIAHDQFQQHMSSGFRALHEEDYERARAAFLEAQSFKPGSPEVKEALTQVDQAIRLTRIESLREKALAAEQSENWKGALQFYLAALELDPNLQFASAGKERSLQQIQMMKRIDFFVNKPSVLEFDRQLEKATLLLKEASEIEPKGPILTRQSEKLGQLVKIAKTPVKVILESDDLTEVAMYRVGRLGRFNERHLHLRPGTYTILGTRDGYKDIRQTIQIEVGEAPVRVTVRCQEKI